MPDSRLDHVYDIVEPLGRSYTGSLNLKFLRCHPASPFKRTDMAGRLPLIVFSFWRCCWLVYSRMTGEKKSDSLFVPVEEVVVGGVRNERLPAHIA
jgi:hypothetical protein